MTSQGGLLKHISKKKKHFFWSTAEYLQGPSGQVGQKLEIWVWKKRKGKI